MALPFKTTDHYDSSFRTCSRRHARSQAGLCHCTNLLMSDQRLGQPSCPPLLFRGERPSQTTPPDTVRNPGNGSTLGTSNIVQGISRSAPCRLASTLQSLPPILHIKAQCSVSSYSKGSRVFPSCRGYNCIFTASSISLKVSGVYITAIITPFVQVKPARTSEFATLGPL